MTIQKEVKQEATAKAKTAKATASAAKSAPKVPDTQVYISKEEELMNFDVVLRGERYRSFWDAEKEHIMFKIKKEHIEAFELHEHYVRGRFIKFEG